MELKTNHSDDIIINIYPTMKCNLKCSYCYSDNSNLKDFEFTREEFIDILNTLNIINPSNKIYLNFLGGEPSLFPYLNEIKILNSNILINITTNGQNPKNILNLNNLQNIELEISLHYEYFSEKYFNKIKEIINKSKFSKTIIINLSKQMVSKIQTIKDFLLPFKDKIKISLNCLTGISGAENCLIKKYIRFFKEFNIEENNSSYFLNDKEIDFIKFEKVYNKINYKNISCYNNIFDIKKNKTIKYFISCNQQEVKDFNIKPMKCPFKHCQINCFADTLKVF